MNDKGQALIEFVLILPVLVFLIFAVIDFGNIVLTRNRMESDATMMLELIAKEASYDDMVRVLNEESDIPISLDLHYQEDGFVQVVLTGNVSLMTPGLNLILGNHYLVKIERNVPYES